MISKPHIVILGAGFGGVSVAKRLVPHIRAGRIAVTIVSRTNYFLFTPLLHEVATGSLSPQSVAEPLREVFAGTGVHIVLASVSSIDRSARTVSLTGSGVDTTLSYDYLVIATGAETNYFNIPGAEANALPLKDLADAARIRGHVISSFERAILLDDPVERAKTLSFVVVGGGATGVETAAELANLTDGMVRRYYRATRDCDPSRMKPCKPEEPLITLIHTGPELLQIFPETLRTAAEDRLRSIGVALALNATVSEVTAHGVKLSSGASIPSQTVVWAAGVKAIVPRFAGKTPELVGGRLAVDAYFRLLGEDRVFALGDSAAYIDRSTLDADPTKTRPLPMLAQVASAQARTVADNLISAVRGEMMAGFQYRSKGSMVSVGQWFAIGQIASFLLSGRLTWWLWRTVYLSKFASWKKRIRIAFEWALELIYPRDVTAIE